MKRENFLPKEIFSYLLIPFYFLGLTGSSLFLLFQVFLTGLRRLIFPQPSNQPYFKPRLIFPAKEKPIVSHPSSKKISSFPKIDFEKLNEGFGGAYERIAYTNILKKLAKYYRVKRVLELNSTYIAGVPAFNSCLLAQAGYDLTITVHSRDYPDAIQAWEIAGLSDKVKIVEWNDDFKTPFRSEEFDLVWNHLAVEHYQDPLPLIGEMKRVSKKLVVTMTLSPWNLGFLGHFLWHKLTRKDWDHGFISNTLISAMEKLHKKAGLKIIESGGCDDPTTPDTVDGQLGGSMTYLDAMPGFVRKHWIWTAINPACLRHWLVSFFWFLERSYPEWFRRITSHHLYTASIKISDSQERRLF